MEAYRAVQIQICLFITSTLDVHGIKIIRPTRCNNFSSLLLDVYLQLNMFITGYNRPDHDQQHCYHHAPKAKPEAATAVVKLLMMGVRTPEIC
jgi:hypothetical protein